MVRVWLVEPKYLDDQRLLGEHHEIHVILGAIAKKHQAKKGGWVKHPETIKYANRVGFLVRRHRKLVQEMKKRGWESGKHHKTQIQTKDIPKSALKDFKPTKKLILKDISDLKKRWKKEGKKGGRVKIKNAPDGI